MKYQQFGDMDIKLSNKKISKRILTNFLGVLVVTFIITAVIFTILSKRFIISETENDLKAAGEVIESNLVRIMEKSEEEEYPVPNKAIRRNLITSVEFFDSFMKMDTVVIDDSGNIVYPLQDWTLERIERNSLDKANYIVIKYTVKDDDLPFKKFVLVKPYEDVKKLRNTGIRAFVISFTIGGIIALLISVAFSKKIYKPIRKLSESITAYNKDRTPVEVYASDDEIEVLAENFKVFTDKISSLDERQKQFFQNSSHELKTPLMSIQGYAEAIKDGVVEGDEVNKSLDIIIAETQRLKNIVDDVIYLSKIDNMEDEFIMVNQPIRPIILESAEIVKPLLTVNDIEFEFLCSEDIHLTCDHEKMKRVFINLIGNASRYAKSKVVVNVNQHENHITIDVIDDGNGFEYGQEDKVFDRFYNGKKGGSGIGLSLTKEIIEKHKGKITAINNMNYGAVFKIEF